MTLLSKAEGPSLSVDDKIKILCYRGICQLVSGKIDDGAQNLQEALCLMSDSPEQRILSVTALQILVTYFLFNKKKATSLEFYTKALHECRALGDTGLLVIPPVNNKDLTMIEADMPEPDVITTQPLRLETICVVSKATEMFSDYETKQAISKSVLRMSNQTKTQIIPHSVGSRTFQRNISSTLKNVQSHQRALDIRVKLFREEHRDTAKSYFYLGVTQHALGNFSLALQSHQRALDLRVKLFGEEHPDTAKSYFYRSTQHALGDFSSALQSH